MSFDILETSTEQGRPVVLYQFTMGNLVWYYTSADETIILKGDEGKLWLPVSISHDEVKQTGEPLNEMLTIYAPSSIGPAQLFMAAVPPRGVMVTIFEKHETSNDIQVSYVGEVSQIGFPQPGSCKISCETISASMTREGLRLAWQRSCPYSVYDPTTCRLDMASQARPFTILAVDEAKVTVEFVSAPASGLLNDGFLEWTHPIRGIEYLPIDTQDGNVLTINSDPGEMIVGAQGKAYPTCRLTPAACQAFGNYDNYGGAEDMPGKSPFDGLSSPFF